MISTCPPPVVLAPLALCLTLVVSSATSLPAPLEVVSNVVVFSAIWAIMTLGLDRKSLVSALSAVRTAARGTA